MKNILSIKEVINLSKSVSDDLGMSLEDDAVLLKKLAQKSPVPLIVKNNNCRLWLDRFYIAYSHDDENDVHYVYLTEFHIREECHSYALARNQRKSDVRLPGQIEEQFSTALKEINKSKKSYHIFKR